MTREVDVPPGQVWWLPPHQPGETGKRCEHKCYHRNVYPVAWGPSDEHYEVFQCYDCRCRAWANIKGDLQEWRRVTPYEQVSL